MSISQPVQRDQHAFGRINCLHDHAQIEYALVEVTNSNTGKKTTTLASKIKQRGERARVENEHNMEGTNRLSRTANWDNMTK